MELTSSPILICMSANTKMENLKVLASINGQTVILTLDNSNKVRSMGKANGRNSPQISRRKTISISTMATTNTIKSTDMVSSYGNQETNILGTITEMRDRDMELCIGQTAASTKATGLKVCNMESAS